MKSVFLSIFNKSFDAEQLKSIFYISKGWIILQTYFSYIAFIYGRVMWPVIAINWEYLQDVPCTSPNVQSSLPWHWLG